MTYFVGIDLGTTNSVVAYFDANGARVLDNRDAKSQTRSVVSLRIRKKKGEPDKEEILVGDTAISYWLFAPEDTIVSVKRLMGRAISDPEVDTARQSSLFKIVEPTDGTSDSVAVIMGGKEYSPSEISTLILKKIKQDAEYRLGGPVTHAVITVPAYFSEVQRSATRRAAVEAGLNVIKLLDEPTAAAVAYGMQQTESNDPQTILVFDLGGGTFDISILMLSGGMLLPLSLMGDMWLGGDNFDEVIINHVLKYIDDEHGLDPRSDTKFMAALKGAAKDAKERLSSSQSTDVIVASHLKDEDGNVIDVELEITREAFGKMIAPLVERTVMLTKKAIDLAKLEISDIDYVLMAGNSTCVPAVQEAIEKLFGKEKVLRKDNPKHVVAMGAAIVAARTGADKIVCQAPSPDDSRSECGHLNSTGQTACEKCHAPLPIAQEIQKSDGQGVGGASKDTITIAPFHYGVQGLGDTFNIFVQKNDPYPTPADAIQTQAPVTMVPNQRIIKLVVYGGEETDKASANVKQGEAIAILPPGLSKGTKVYIKLWLDADGIFQLSANLADGTDLKPRLMQGGADAKAIQALVELEQNVAVSAQAMPDTELPELLATKEAVYSQVRDGDFKGAIEKAKQCREKIKGVETTGGDGSIPDPNVEQLIKYVEYILRRYHWLLKSVPEIQGKLEIYIDDLRDAAKRKPDKVAEYKEQLMRSMNELPPLVIGLLDLQGIIASRVQPFNPIVADKLYAEFDQLEQNLAEDLEAVERVPASMRQSAVEQWFGRLQQLVTAFQTKLQAAVESAMSKRTVAITCPNLTCNQQIPAGICVCPSCNLDLTQPDFPIAKSTFSKL